MKWKLKIHSTVYPNCKAELPGIYLNLNMNNIYEETSEQADEDLNNFAEESATNADDYENHDKFTTYHTNKINEE